MVRAVIAVQRLVRDRGPRRAAPGSDRPAGARFEVPQREDRQGARCFHAVNRQVMCDAG